ncbi:MAG TPA: M55 family metallopeptidase [Oscillospiraceae bacterium]|nr:M55 family metallopeptidase [Oscillospiraceae bacterium]HPF55793.1 M55 family metallopeptidase [Clostridiales bacterium]HPK35343.1 M55 family metallopeptidase [Oscillospiraceae bacterium]HPR74641.1 M55 family metallopeptidase [Oscillospiraceae bacterium]
MTVLIITDLEGASGVDRMDQVSEIGSEGNLYAMKRLTADTNAAIAGCFDGGADKVWVLDGHGPGGLHFADLDKRALVPEDRYKWDEIVIAGGVDLFMEVGAHAMAGTLNGFLDHTQNSRQWYNYYVNGRKMGETGQLVLFCGAYDVPFVMLAGDEAACVEAKALLGNIETAVVKYGIGRNQAKLEPLEVAEQRIYDAAKTAMKRASAGEFKPYKPILPLEVKLELYRSDFCDDKAKQDNIERLDARTLRKVVTKIVHHKDLLI